MTLRFVITVDAAWKITTTCPDLPAWRPETEAPAELISADDGSDHLIPRPQFALHAPDTDHDTLGSADGVSEVMALYDALRERRASRDEQERFGHYLFDALLGNNRWSELVQTAQAEGHQAIELALGFRPDDIDLGRLNWEMLCADGGFIVAGTPMIKVAITRLVDTAYGAPQPLDVPPRALFIVGSSLHDEQIRPAAELYTLLKLARGGRAMRCVVLQRPKPDEIRRQIEEFQPEIVHYIAHGGIDQETRRGYLVLPTGEEEENPRRFAAQILQDLRKAVHRATIVVLSACSTSGAPGTEKLFGAHDGVSMAAELVAGGVPIVIGMAGRVSDLTSRLFSRTFAESVVRGQPLIRATADARAAAFVSTENPIDGMDWALPTVFLSSEVPTDYRPLDVAMAQARWADLDGWIKGYDDGHLPVFCARDNFLPLFRRMFEADAPKHGLAAYTASNTQGTGRTRLLRELAAYALRDGHLPLLLTSEQTHPHTAAELSRQFLDEMSRVRVNVLGIDEEETQLSALAMGDSARLDRNVRMAFERSRGITPHVINRALQVDLKNLRKDVAHQVSYFARSHSRIVVLIDDVDQYGELLGEVLDRNGLFTPYGLGTKAEPVPVVLTWALGTAGDQWVRHLIPNQQVHPWLEVAELAPFSVETGEDLMAYQTVLLHPFAAAGTAEDNVLRRSWVFNPSMPEESMFHAVRNAARRMLKGIPARFHQSEYEIWVQLAEESGFLVPARDEDHLARLKVHR